MTSVNQNSDQTLDTGAETAPVVEVFRTEEDADLLPRKQYCVFRAGRERFCFAVLDVEEVVEWPNVTAVPLAPPFLMGIFNLRGLIIPVIDIGLTESRRPDLSPKHVVVACLRGQDGGNDLRLGVAADEVFGAVTTTEPLLLEEAPRDVPYCCGMLRDAGRLALAVDLKRLTENFPVPVI
jgi:chemotaxis signal transduction protein